MEQYLEAIWREDRAHDLATALAHAIVFASATYFYDKKIFQLKDTNERLDGFGVQEMINLGAQNIRRSFDSRYRILNGTRCQIRGSSYIDFENLSM